MTERNFQTTFGLFGALPCDWDHQEFYRNYQLKVVKCLLTEPQFFIGAIRNIKPDDFPHLESFEVGLFEIMAQLYDRHNTVPTFDIMREECHMRFRNDYVGGELETVLAILDEAERIELVEGEKECIMADFKYWDEFNNILRIINWAKDTFADRNHLTPSTLKMRKEQLLKLTKRLTDSDNDEWC